MFEKQNSEKKLSEGEYKGTNWLAEDFGVTNFKSPNSKAYETLFASSPQVGRNFTCSESP